MRILYGVVGEGMGHALRSRVVLEELSKEHEVHIVVSGRAKDYLAQRFPNVHEIWGLHIVYEGNQVNNWSTLMANVKGALRGWPMNLRQYLRFVRTLKADAVITDFESFSYLFGKNLMLPIISIDNIQIINRCAHDASLIAGFEDQFELTRSIVKSKVPGCFHYLVTSFFTPPVRKERTTLVPSILRQEILQAKSERGEHLLVYQTANTNVELPQMLKKTGLPCRVYGLRRELKAELQDDNLTPTAPSTRRASSRICAPAARPSPAAATRS
jgi:uncharacterized protein (TIGR00661 family)